MKLHAFGPAGFILSAQTGVRSKWHLWLGSECLRSGARSAATCGSGRPQNMPTEFTACATCAPSTGVFVALPSCLARGFVRSSVPPLAWGGRSRVAPAASANKWPHPVTSLPCQMSSSKPLISHLFKAHHYTASLGGGFGSFSHFNFTSDSFFKVLYLGQRPLGSIFRHPGGSFISPSWSCDSHTEKAFCYMA